MQWKLNVISITKTVLDKFNKKFKTKNLFRVKCFSGEAVFKNWGLFLDALYLDSSPFAGDAVSFKYVSGWKCNILKAIFREIFSTDWKNYFLMQILYNFF